MSVAFYFAGRTGYYSNDMAFCGLRSWGDWLTSGGVDNANHAPYYDHLSSLYGKLGYMCHKVAFKYEKDISKGSSKVILGQDY